ncbi:putative gag-pol polyprotein [Cucumis melo var. makuwa]|uniref:Gag-pol polyprotein n=1 Tax=Cucumis melo var. makuwa TaxID=1194695 RepID=A0A5D3BGZ7_CUCMM|nr:putative gag-pol polyprotein [Cucumis melo var. makuwa]TYJ97921.1 putative gag-pol polyprotein [Cucumis melo var. makuwa]
MDEKKVKAIRNWPIPKSIKEVQAFLDLASFYRKFIYNLSIIATPITDCLKKEGFLWKKKQQDNFEALKKKLSDKPVLKLLDFTQPFEVAVNAFRTSIGAILSQSGQPIEYFSEKLSQSRQMWSTYE